MIQKTIKIKGNKDHKITVCGDDKLGFTLILIISADGYFLKPILIAKGKTNRSLKKFQLDDNIIGTHSNNGWINNGIMKIALQQIYKVTNGQKSILLLDQFTVHTSEFIINIAKEYNIELIYVPKGMTAIFQPLDVSINGILKQKAKKLWRNDRINNSEGSNTVKNGVKHFLIVKNDIKKETIINSFKKSCFNKKYIKK